MCVCVDQLTAVVSLPATDFVLFARDALHASAVYRVRRKRSTTESAVTQKRLRYLPNSSWSFTKFVCINLVSYNIVLICVKMANTEIRKVQLRQVASPQFYPKNRASARCIQCCQECVQALVNFWQLVRLFSRLFLFIKTFDMYETEDGFHNLKLWRKRNSDSVWTRMLSYYPFWHTPRFWSNC